MPDLGLVADYFEALPDVPILKDHDAYLLPSPAQDVPIDGQHRAVLEAGGIFDGRNGSVENGDAGLRALGKNSEERSLEEHMRDWVLKKIANGASEDECRIPFMDQASRMVDCRLCGKSVASGMDVLCTVRGCAQAYHKSCARINLGFSGATEFKCPQHSCFLCKQKGYWRCLVCTMAAHSKCSPWPEAIVFPRDKPGSAICWRHPSDWRLQQKECSILDVQHKDPISNIEEVFNRLPLPYIEVDFKMDAVHNSTFNNQVEPDPYVHIKRNVYLIKKKRDPSDFGTGCTSCDANSLCLEDCECRVQSVCCSKKCYCTEKCKNRPFRKEKKLKIVKTQLCGWGVEAAELIKKGEFLIEYIGEVIDDALCEARLWDMKYRGAEKFYMCEIRKDFIIDATFKGNASRFLNHSCEPNCKLEKWQVDGETRVGVFASGDIQVGEPLTYDYKFVHFGHNVKCCCGSANCLGYLGSKKKSEKPVIITKWGSKRKRTSVRYGS